jgi:integrase/recombinase XerD
VEQFLKARRSVGYSTYLSLVGMSQLLDYLRTIGAVPLAATATLSTPTEAVLERYANHLVHERGLGSQSAVDYVRAAKVFLACQSTTAALDLDGLSSVEVSEYVLLECQRSTHAHARRTTSRLRSLLRFLFVEGLMDTALAPAVPSVSSRADALPKAVAASDVALLLRR